MYFALLQVFLVCLPFGVVLIVLHCALCGSGSGAGGGAHPPTVGSCGGRQHAITSRQEKELEAKMVHAHQVVCCSLHSVGLHLVISDAES